MPETEWNSLEYTPTWVVAVVCFIIVLISLAAERCLHPLGKGKAQFLSLEALHQLHIFIFVLAIVYVIFCAATMILGSLKVQRWKHWEESLQRDLSKSHNKNSRFKPFHAWEDRIKFFEQRSGYSTIVGFLISFLKQFYGSVTRTDYIALRHGFIMTHFPGNPRYHFHKYMLRTLEFDFKKVVGISWYLWLFVVLFLLLNLEGWHAYFWLSFLPLILLLIVGAKLEHIIISLAGEFEEKKKNEPEPEPVQNTPQGTGEITVTPSVKPSDKHFWFGRPSIFLYLIHFILFQNSFEIAFFLWVLVSHKLITLILRSLVINEKNS